MMRAKTLIKFYSEQGLEVDEVASKVNVALCRNETAKMFVTVWFGFLRLDSGVLSYVHAGHTLPVLIGDEVSYINQKKSMVMGMFENAKYLRQEITLHPGDSVYLYTDGVTEAQDVSEKLYGDDRLLSVISKKVKAIDTYDNDKYCEEACEIMRDDIKAFTEGAEQYDDITMMMVKYR